MKNLSPRWFSLRSGIRGAGDYLESVDTLRGWAIVMVFLFHAWGISGAPEAVTGDVLLLAFVEAGRTGVTLFFVISGFLLSLPWLSSKLQGEPSPRVGNYYLARVLRILPLYCCAVGLSAVVSGEWQVALRAITFQFVGFEIFPFSVVWWTLTTEVQFYLLLPLLMWLLLAGPLHRICLIILLLAWGFFYFTEVLSNPGGEVVGSYFFTKSIFARLPAFLVGIVAAWIYLRLRSKPALTARRTRVLGMLVIGLSVLILDRILRATVSLGELASERSWHIHHTYESLLWMAVLLAFVLPGRSGMLVGFHRWMAYIGKLSYSLYLWHVPVLFYLIYPLKGRMGEDYYGSSAFYLLPVMAFIMSLLVSVLTYRWIELPALNFKRRLPV